MLVCVSSFTNTKPCWVTQYEKGPVSGLDHPTTQRALHVLLYQTMKTVIKDTFIGKGG